MNFQDLYLLKNSPPRICDAFPSLSKREGGRPHADVGVSFYKITNSKAILFYSNCYK